MFLRVKRTAQLRARTSEFDPGCVKTPCCCYDSLVILREESMRRFVEEADRGQSTLLPDYLDDFIDEQSSSGDRRVCGHPRFGPDELRRGGAGDDRAAVVPSLGSPETVHLWLSEPGAVEPAAGTRGRTQCRGHVAAGSARS